MLILALTPTRRIPPTVLATASGFKLVPGYGRPQDPLSTPGPQRRWMNFQPHQASLWRTLPWDQKVYLRFLEEHKKAADKGAEDLSWTLPLMPFIMRRGSIMYALNLKHYVILLDRISLSVKLDDPKSEPVLTVEAYMMTSLLADNVPNPWKVLWSQVDTAPALGPNQAPWDIHVRSEYDIRPKDNPSLPLTKVSRFFDKECSRVISWEGVLRIPIKYLGTAIPRRWFSASEESVGRLDPYRQAWPLPRDFLAYCPALADPDVGPIDAHYHGYSVSSSGLSASRLWPFGSRTCLVFSHQGKEKERMLSAARKLAQKFHESGRVRTAKVKELSLEQIVKKVTPARKNNPDLNRILITRELEKWRGMTMLIHVSTNISKSVFCQLVELVSRRMGEDTAVILTLLGRKPYSLIFDHESETVREAFGTEVIFRPPLEGAAVLEKQEATPEEDEQMKRLIEKFLSQEEQRKVREREEAERRRLKAEEDLKMAPIRKEMERRRQAELQRRIEEQKRAQRQREIDELKELKLQHGVDALYEAAVKHEIKASLREEGLDTATEADATRDLDSNPFPEETDKDTEEAQLIEGSISIENGDICIEKEGSITVMDGFLNKRDGSIVIKTGFVKMDDGNIIFVQRSDATYFREDFSKMSISFEDGISTPSDHFEDGISTPSDQEDSAKEDSDVDSYDEGDPNADLVSLVDAVIDIKDGWIEIIEGSIKVTGEEGFDDNRKILSSIRIKRGKINIISGSATFKEGKEGFINCSFDISKTTLNFKDGFSDVKELDDADSYSVRNWGDGYKPITGDSGYSSNNWIYEPIVEIPDTARERVYKRQEAIEKVARAEYKARIERERAEEKARIERERAEEKARIERERAEQKARNKIERAEKKARIERERIAEEERLRKERIAEAERLRKEKLAKKRADMRANLQMSFLQPDNKKKGGRD
ncbi:hypothetical protein B0T21DRAFT_396646 [Apiosordaria backusii]|uniref:Uncharacterized protein n=1 Tax=Apiosordaria backusii TaxID=314023 RepID=A0AA40A718_9PEZI|nr:hypothetical protein B0T21DRAFT_396646 [Apiosordaria backusii]